MQEGFAKSKRREACGAGKMLLSHIYRYSSGLFRRGYSDVILICASALQTAVVADRQAYQILLNDLIGRCFINCLNGSGFYASLRCMVYGMPCMAALGTVSRVSCICIT